MDLEAMKKRADELRSYRGIWAERADDMDALVAEVERLKADQQDWRKGVALIASALGEQDPPDLCAPRIAEIALRLEAKTEAALALHSPMERAPDYCRTCKDLLPCPTVEALMGRRE